MVPAQFEVVLMRLVVGVRLVLLSCFGVFRDERLRRTRTGGGQTSRYTCSRPISADVSGLFSDVYRRFLWFQMVGKMGGEAMSHLNSSGSVDPSLYYPGQKRPGEDGGEAL